MLFDKAHRLNPASVFRIIYRRGYALWPIKCSNGKWIWLQHYMIKFRQWQYDIPFIDDVTELERISDDEYIVRKLADNL
jgi:hypothetical protein